MAPARDNNQPQPQQREVGIGEAGTSQTTPPDNASFIKQFGTTNSAPASPRPQQPAVVRRVGAKNLQKSDLLKLRQLMIKRRALKPYSRTPLPSIECLLPMRENFTPPEPTISPLSVDSCAFLAETWCPDELYDWTDVCIGSFCNWPGQAPHVYVPQTASAPHHAPTHSSTLPTPAAHSLQKSAARHCSPPVPFRPQLNMGQAV